MKATMIYIKTIETQAKYARTAQEFRQEGLPLFAEWHEQQAEAWHYQVVLTHEFARLEEERERKRMKKSFQKK